MKRIIYTRPDGAVSVVVPALGSRLIEGDPSPYPAEQFSRNPAVIADAVARGEIAYAESEDDWIERVRGKDVPADATNVHLSDEDDVPNDRTFRDAWTIGGGRVEVDMDKARAIHKDRMRVARKPLLEALDVEYQRADERGDAAGKADVAARKQVLRDVTADPAIEAATTPDELKSAWPVALGNAPQP